MQTLERMQTIIIQYIVNVLQSKENARSLRRTHLLLKKKLLDVERATGLKCFLFNAQSICNKTNGVIEFLKENKCDICCVDESWLVENDTAKVAEIKDFGYNIKVQPRKGRGGGICVMHKSNIDVQKCKIGKYTTFECLEKKKIISVTTKLIL